MFQPFIRLKKVMKKKKSQIAFPDLKNSTYIVKSDSIFLLGVPNANKKD